MTLYTAATLSGIAELFEKFAVSAAEQALRHSTQKGKAFEHGRASAWDEAARVIRQTTLAKVQP